MNLFIEFIHEHILAIDFGMFVLIWLVQLIIYPVFEEVSIEKFAKWHEIYCRRIAFVVLPLMIAQLFEAAASCFLIGGGLEWGKLACVLAVWLFTFLVSARCHQKLAKEGKNTVVIGRLISTNWFRTFLWSLILFISYIQY